MYLQAQVDSSQFLWFTDVKGAASSFMNEEMPADGPLSTADVVILSEGLFHARAEVHLPKKILILTMERPFKDRGVKSIWQVTGVEEKEWPKSK